jgi:hypothetical protein
MNLVPTAPNTPFLNFELEATSVYMEWLIGTKLR